MSELTCFNDLPRDCIYEIAKTLGLRDLFSLSSTCKRIYTICESLQIKPLDNNYDLLPYQREFIKWMLTVESKGPKKGIVNLTMGAGKTVTILTTIQLNRKGLTLIVVDLSLIPIWINEIDKFYSVKDRLKYKVYHKDYTEKIKWSKLKPGTVVLTTPQTLKNRVLSNEHKIKDVQFHRIVFDEVHVLGEHTATIIKTCLKFDVLWVVSGTPFSTNKKLSPGTFNKNICALLDNTKGKQYLFRDGKPVETPEVHMMPLNIRIIDPTTHALVGSGGSYGHSSSSKSTRHKLMNEYLENLGPDKCLVFCNPSEVDEIEQYLDIHADKAITRLKYDSSLNSKKRDEAYSKFKSDLSIKVLICSFTLGAKGLNLMEANHAIFVSTPKLFGDRRIPNSNGVVQALSRMYRYGQTKECFVQIYDGSCQYDSIIREAFPHAHVIVE